MPQNLREYVWAHTERLFPRSKPEVRDALRRSICDYAEWLSMPSNRRGPPSLAPGSTGITMAEKLYSQFLREPGEDRDKFYHTHRNDPKRAYKGR
ncbi:MAG TPA: hypothetical protein VJH04_02530 [archaeon]|nr:hypothetical protein [archaeon]